VSSQVHVAASPVTLGPGSSWLSVWWALCCAATCGTSSAGRAQASQAWGRGFEPRVPLRATADRHVGPWRPGNKRELGGNFGPPERDEPKLPPFKNGRNKQAPPLWLGRGERDNFDDEMGGARQCPPVRRTRTVSRAVTGGSANTRARPRTALRWKRWVFRRPRLGEGGKKPAASHRSSPRRPAFQCIVSSETMQLTRRFVRGSQGPDYSVVAPARGGAITKP
jgi:hypothetical protein